MAEISKDKKTTVKRTRKPVSGMFLNVYDIAGKEKEKVSLPKEIFDFPINKKLLVQYIHIFLTNQRQGTVSTKTRGDVTGSTRKIYRQKGTGRARHGDIKAPIFVGGGVVGGPKPKEYSLKFNKKQKKQALFSALTLKNKEQAIIGLNQAALQMQSKTKAFVDFLKQLKLIGSKIIIVVPKMERNNLALAARNIEDVRLADASSLNAYEVLRSEKIIIIDQALEILKKHFLKNNEN